MNRPLIILAVLSLLLTPTILQAQSAAPTASGVYIGGYAGFVSDRFHYVEPDDPAVAISPDANGFAGGVLGGYDRGINRWLFGVEGDAGAGTAKVSAGTSAGNKYTAIDPSWSAHVRGRIGCATGSLVPYLAVGVALARVNTDDTDQGFGDYQATHVGWTLGAGVQRTVTSRFTIRGEYLYDDYGQKDGTISAPPSSRFFPSYAAQTSLKAHTVRGGVIVRF